MKAITAEQRGFTLIELVVVLVIIAVFFTAVSINLGSGSRQFEIKKLSKRIYAKMLLAQEEAILSGKPLGLAIEEIIEFNNNEFKQEHYYRLQWLILEYEADEQAQANGALAQLLSAGQNNTQAQQQQNKKPPLVRARRWQALSDDLLQSMEIPAAYLQLNLMVEEQTIDLHDDTREVAFEREGDDDEDEEQETEKQKVAKPIIYFLPNGELFDFQMQLIDGNDEQQGFVIKGDSGGTIDYQFLDDAQIL